MTRTEALSFLDLPEIVSDEEFWKRLNERHEYYKDQIKTSSSAFLRRLNSIYLSQVLLMEKEAELLIFDSIPVTLAEIECENEEVELKNVELGKKLNIESFKLKEIEKKQKNSPIAFLIRHTEDRSIITFPLFAERNFVGRRQYGAFLPFIALEEDDFVSRLHAVIHIDEDNPANCYIDDSGLFNEGRASSNGTYLNGNMQRITRILLADADTIQIGKTKLVFRFANTDSIKGMIEEIRNQSYMNTIAITR